MSTASDMPVVLVVDDDPSLLSLLARAGARYGYEILTALDGAEGLAIARSRRIDVVVTDLEMPGQGGHALIRHLRTEQPELPIVLMSGAGAVDDVVEAYRAGVADYLKKPFHPSDFSQSVQRALDSRGPKSPLRTATPAVAVATPAAVEPVVVPTVASADLEVPEPLTVKLIELQEQPGLSGDIVVRVIERSQTIAARVLALANSAYYRGQRPVTNLREAVVRLGNRAVLNLAVTLTHRGFYTLPSEAHSELLSRIWTESVFVATLSREIGRRGVGGDPEDVYLAALFHDIGEVVLVRQAAATGAPLDLPSITLACDARHESVGEAILTAWKLPPRLCRVAAHHHRPPPAGTPSLTATEEQIVRILMVADSVASERGRGSPLRHPVDAAAAMAALGLTARHLEPMVDRTLGLLGEEAAR